MNCQWAGSVLLLWIFLGSSAVTAVHHKDVESLVKEIQEAETEEADHAATPSVNLRRMFRSSSTQIKAMGYNALAQQLKLKKYAKKYGLSGKQLFEKLKVEQIELKACGNGEDILMTSDGPVPKPDEFDCCPFSKIKCKNKKYRSLDGSCNCKTRPSMGRSNQAFPRFLPPDYADGISAPRVAKDGTPLPSARLLSSEIFKAQPNAKNRSEFLTVMHLSFGQLLGIDTDRIPTSTLMASNGTLVPISCGDDNCATEGATQQECFPIHIPANDSFFSNHGCLFNIRSQAFLADDCEIGPRQQVNAVNSWLDASVLYSNSVEELEKIRDTDKKRGRMAVSQNPFNDNCKPLAPTQDEEACKRFDPGPDKCFIAGDGRVLEAIGVNSLYILLIRLHNNIEEQLHLTNKNWNGEKLFQETKKLVGAIWQNIVYKEFVSVVLGPAAIEKYSLKIVKDECFDGYNCRDFSGDATNVFATAAGRFGHSQIPDKIMLKNAAMDQSKKIPFESVIFNPDPIFETQFNDTCGVAAIMLGHTQQLVGQRDEIFADAMRNLLFSTNPPGRDLVSSDIQRGRDHGLPGYNAWRRWCDLPVASDFDDLTDIPADLRPKFQKLYKHVDDIDLWAAGMAENRVPGGVVGNTFACILGRQFKNLKFADRFWFERCQKRTGCNLDQINNIREYSSGKLLCETLDVTQMQKYTMMKSRQEARAGFGNISVEELTELIPLYEDEDNKPRACEDLSGIIFSLFKD